MSSMVVAQGDAELRRGGSILKSGAGSSMLLRTLGSSMLGAGSRDYGIE